jgi:hypothetical protein
VYGYDIRQKLSFSLGKYTAVFQAEVYVIKTCTAENLDGAIETSIFYHTVKLQLKHFAITRATQN